MAGFGQTLRDETAIYQDSAAIPKNTTANGSSVVTGDNGQSGKIAARCEITVTGTLADTKALTLVLQTSADNSTWVTLDTFTVTASGAKTWVVGELVHEFLLPRNVLDYTRVTVATDDAAATGSIDVFGNMVP